jgi:sugar phosphate isomerase/epimerase
MNTLSRRHFLAGAGGAAAWGLCATYPAAANPLGLPIGCQTWPVRDKIGKDLEGTLAQLASAGFRNIELCSPPSYAKAGFGPLESLSAAELKQKIHAAGLDCQSCHYGLGELKDHLSERLDYAKGLGLRQMVIASFGLPKDARMDDWMAAAEHANHIGEQTRKAGIQLGYHNHDMEFKKLDGELIYDKLLGKLDPSAVKMQFQVGVISIGINAVDYFEKYPGRFVSMHLQDWSPDQKKEVALGKGAVDWKKVFAAAKRAGIKNYFVEMDPELMKASVPYLHELK